MRTTPLKGARTICSLHFVLGLPLKGLLLCPGALATRSGKTPELPSTRPPTAPVPLERLCLCAVPPQWVPAQAGCGNTLFWSFLLIPAKKYLQKVIACATIGRKYWEYPVPAFLPAERKHGTHVCRAVFLHRQGSRCFHTYHRHRVPTIQWGAENTGRGRTL